MEVRVIRPGMLTTVQDLGRTGHRCAGVPLSGAMDPFSLRIANALVGNEAHAAVIEFTMVGPELEFSHDALIAVCGAQCEGIEVWKPLRVAAGKRVVLGACAGGARGYLAISGGVDVPTVLGSRSTFLRAGLGGWEGRALAGGDVLPISEIRVDENIGAGLEKTSATSRHTGRVGDWRIDRSIFPPYTASPILRVIAGAQAHEFGDAFFQQPFSVSPQSDRMGIKLTGSPLARSNTEDLLSSAVAPGTIQVPPDGQPIVLMADAQTIGGYPQIAHVVGIDLPVIAQLRPGDLVRFTKIMIEEAHRLTLAHEHAIALLRQGLAAKLRSGVQRIEWHGAQTE